MKALILALLLCFGTVAVTGCRLNTARATLNADKTVITSANTALAAWADYYVKESRKAVQAGNQARRDQLEEQRALVTKSWKEYQSAVTGIILAQSSNYANATNGVASQIVGSMAAAAGPFISLVNSLLH